MLSVDGRLREILQPPPPLSTPSVHLFIHPSTHSFSFPLCASVESDMRSYSSESNPPPPLLHTLWPRICHLLLCCSTLTSPMQRNGGVQLYLSLCGRYVTEVRLTQEPPCPFHHPAIVRLRWTLQSYSHLSYFPASC